MTNRGQIKREMLTLLVVASCALTAFSGVSAVIFAWLAFIDGDWKGFFVYSLPLALASCILGLGARAAWRFSEK
jgi:hypothetical protein